MKPRIGSAFTASRAWMLFVAALALFLSGPARAADGDVIDRITSAPAFLQRILWTGVQAPPVTESDALWSALEQMRDDGPQSGFAALEVFIARHPKSAWTPSVRANLAYMYREHGRYTPALEHWEQAWAATRHDKTGDGKAVADYVLAHWTRLLASLGRLETLEMLMEETQGRLLDGGPLQQMFNATKEGVRTMKFQPDLAYRCGTFALVSVARALEVPSTNWVGILEIPSPETGFSIKDLTQYSGEFGLGLRAVRRPEGATELAIPSMVHWRQNHYAALVAEEGDYIQVADPTFGRKRWLHRDVVNSEASGHFLVAATGAPGNWRELLEAEAGAVYGRGYSTDFEDGDDEDCPKDEDPDSESQDAEAPITQHDPNAQDDCEECPPGSSGDGEPCEDDPEGCSPCETGQGMAVWRVSQPYTSLTLIDTPLYYTTSSGKSFAATLTYKQRNTTDHNFSFSFGPFWECNLLSYLKVDVSVPNQAIFFAPQGGRRHYEINGSRHFHNYSRVTVNGSTYSISYAKGGNVVYGQTYSFWSGITTYFPTQRMDRRGRVTYFFYTVLGRSLVLSSIQDQDGRNISLFYNNPSYPYRITEVRDYMNRSAKFTYNAGGRLINIEDAHGISTSFIYDAQGFITSMTTPYGTTLFHKGSDVQPNEFNVINRWLRVTEPGGGKQLFIYRNMSQYLSEQDPQPLIPDQYPDQIPDTGLVLNSIRTDGLYWENSFHWGRQQYAALSAGFQATGDPNDLTVADYDLAHMKNWLRHADLIKRVGRVPNMERLPSPDGQTVGQITWYDYAPKPGIHYEGEHAAPSMVATVLPNGQTRFTDYFRNGLGKPISVYSTYDNGGTIDYRETLYDYDIDGISLLKIRHLRSSGPETVVEYGYHPTLPRTITSITRYANDTTPYTTTYGYNGQGRLISGQSSTGLNTTYSYDANGFLSQVTDSPVSRTELYTYLGGNVRTHTDWRGYTRTFTRDNLQRLTRIDYTGGSFEEFRYTADGTPTGPKWLDLTYHRDRMGYVTQHTYNALRQRTSTTNPRNFTTIFAYCPCGTLESIDDPAPQGGLTEFFYDFNGRRTTVIFPDNTFINYTYDRAGQLIEAEDVLGFWTLDYNIQGLLTNVTSLEGSVLSVEYDIDDHPVAVTDANDVTRVQTFDRLGRLLTRSWPDTGVETFVWSARGLISYTDQEGKAAAYAYDQASRRISHTTPNTEILGYTYNAAGDLLTLTDGRGKITTWTYDTQGRNTAKKYHGQTFNQLTYGYNNNGWLTWRRQWTTGSTYQQTGYSYDPNGNLTFINYPAGTTDVGLTYDALDRVTQMTDAAGTTAYTYHLNRRLQSENGPWANDTVTYGYHTQSPFLRTSLTLQQPAGSWNQSYTYDAARRLDTLTSPAGQFAYDYHLAGRKVENLFLPTGGRIANDYATDPLARLTGTWLLNSAQQTLNYHGYEHNLRNDITRHTRTDASFVDYDYDDLGQLTDAVGSGGQSVELLAYGYDTGWNMTGDGTTGYFVNDRNQVTSDTSGAYVSYTYDAHGNRTSKTTGVGYNNLYYTYDAENRLTRVEQPYWGYPPVQRTEFVYDGLSRLRIRKEYQYTGSTWQWTGETRYIYDGRRVIQERSSANTPTVTYTLGNDLSGSLEGAGGIGGMLARSHGYSGSTGNWSTHNYYHADAGGNITCLINSNNGITAIYRYDPFGRTLFQSGTMANANVYRFSSKEVHGFTGMYYYGFRFYDPGLQRWINRDPIGEFGGINLYGFVLNDPLNAIDPFGLSDTSIHAACRNPHSAREVAKEYLEEVLKDQSRRKAQRQAIQEANKQFNASPRAARNQLRKAVGPGKGPAHHIATLESRSRPVAQKAAQGGFKWNGPNNGIRLPDWMHKGYPKWHREYNDFLNRALDAAHKARPNMKPDEAAALLQRLVDLERQYLQSCASRGVLP